MSSLHERLEEVFRNVFDDEDLELSPTLTAPDIAGWDSVAHINLMFAIEQAFAIRFSGDEFSDVENVGELEALIDGKISGGPKVSSVHAGLRQSQGA
ncbi:MAG: acyl carrier protein [Caulobacteraceae bacterium]